MVHSEIVHNYSTEEARLLLREPLEAILSLQDSPLKREVQEYVELYGFGEEDFSMYSEESFQRIYALITDEINQKGSPLSDEIKAGIDFLLTLSFYGNVRSSEVRDDSISGHSLKHIEGLLYVLEEEDYLWFYRLLVSKLSPSEQKKIIKAYRLDFLTESPSKEEPLQVVEPKKSLRDAVRKLFLVPDIQKLDEEKISQSDHEIASKLRHKVYLLIRLYSTVTKKTMLGSSANFLGLDRSGREALCWRELELSRALNEDYSRLAATIAWRIWLFKEPLAQHYASSHNIDFSSLSFSQRAEITKTAAEHYSEEEMAAILDAAVEAELEKRKGLLVPETRKKFKGKKVTLGAELEIINPPFELGLQYSWYENLDRNLFGDSLAHSEEINDDFLRFAQWKDAQEVLSNVKRLAFKVQNLQKYINIDDRSAISDEEKKRVEDDVRELISQIDTAEVRMPFLDYMNSSEFDYLDRELLQILNQIWNLRLMQSVSRERNLREQFNAFIEKTEGEQRYKKLAVYKYDYFLQDLSRKASIMLDAYKHHMGQAQAIGHNYTYDSLGEHALSYVSGDFKQPYRLYAREIWGLAQAGFHDLETDSRPMHITIGWEEYFDRGFSISSDDVLREASILNAGLMATGVGFRKYNTSFQAEYSETMRKKKKHKQIINYGDTGRRRVLRSRQFTDEYWTIEFRGFSPSKKDIPRLFNQVGWLGTAMIAYLCCEKYPHQVDDVDRQLAQVWETYRETMVELFEKERDFPPLFKANSWKVGDFTDSVEGRQLTNFYRAVSRSNIRQSGFAINVKAAVFAAEKGVQRIFEDAPASECEVGEDDRG